MPFRAALTHPAVKRLIALSVAYVLVMQALFGAGAQLRVLLSEAPGLCTLLGFQDPGQPKHAVDACAVHCVAQASGELAGLAALAALLLGIAGWTQTERRRAQVATRRAPAYWGRGPPR
jgi:hypothetical protein